MKKVLSVILSLAFVLLIVSCSSGKKTETTQSDKTEQTTQVVTTTQFEEYIDEEGRLVVKNAGSLMEKLDMGIRVTSMAKNPKYYVVDNNVGMITFEFEGVSYVYKGSKEVKDYKLLSGIDGTPVNFYLIAINANQSGSGDSEQTFYTVNQYGEGEKVTSTVISWNAYVGTEHEAWYVIYCLQNLSESDITTILTYLVGM